MTVTTGCGNACARVKRSKAVVVSDSGPKRKDTFEHSVQDVVKEAKSRGWIKRHCRAWDGNFPCSEIKLQLQVKAECRRSQGCAVARPAVAGNDEGMPVRPETLGIVSLATSAPGLEVRFFILQSLLVCFIPHRCEQSLLRRSANS